MIQRRDLLKAAALLPWTRQVKAAAAAVGPMKITKVEAVRFRPDLRMQGVSPNWTWVRLHTDTGLMGLGESYPNDDAQCRRSATTRAACCSERIRRRSSACGRISSIAFRISRGAARSPAC